MKRLMLKWKKLSKRKMSSRIYILKQFNKMSTLHEYNMDFLLLYMVKQY